jgi:hypothetical protein
MVLLYLVLLFDFKLMKEKINAGIKRKPKKTILFDLK